MSHQHSANELIEYHLKLKKILIQLSNGNYKCMVDLPNFRKVKAEITQVDLTNIIWKPIQVHFTEGIQQEVEELEYGHHTFGYGYEDEGVMVKKNVPYTNDWVSVNVISLE